MVKDGHQKELIKLESAVELLCELPYTINELYKDRSTLIICVIAVTMANTLIELVTK